MASATDDPVVREWAREVGRVVATLSSRTQEVLDLVYRGGLTQRQVSLATGLAEPTVRRCIAVALQHIGTRLRDNFEQERY